MVDQKATVILATVTASPKPVFVYIFKKLTLLLNHLSAFYLQSIQGRICKQRFKKTLRKLENARILKQVVQSIFPLRFLR